MGLSHMAFSSRGRRTVGRNSEAYCAAEPPPAQYACGYCALPESYLTPRWNSTLTWPLPLEVK
jgi:hypothetical protein